MAAVGVGRIVPWVALFKNCLRNFDPLKNMAAMGGRLFALYGHEEILQKSSSLKPLFLIGNNFTGIFLGGPFSKIVCEKNMAAVGVGRIVPWVALFKNCLRNFDPLKNMAAMGGRLFALYGHEEILQKSSSLKSLVLIGNNFTGIFLGGPFSKIVCEKNTWPRWGWGGLFLGWPFSKIVCEILIRPKTWPSWGGLFALYGHEEILQKSSRKPLVRIWNNF